MGSSVSHDSLLALSLTKEHVQKVYGSGAKEYDRIMESVYGWLIDRPRVMEAFGPKPGDHLLEIGIGTGLNLKHYPAGVDVTGTDFTREMLAEAESKKEEFSGTSLNLCLEDSERLPFPDASFDGILATLTLCATPDAEAAIREMARVCRPGGRIAAFEVARSPHPIISQMQETLLRPSSTTVGFPPPSSDIPGGVIVWDPSRDYLAMAERLGLHKEGVEWSDEGHPVMARYLVSWRK